MQITVKKLQSPEEFIVVVEPSTKIIDIKRQIAIKHKIKIPTQKLLYMGKALLNDKTISAYPNIKDGAKIHLLEVKPEGLQSVARFFKEKGMPDEKAKHLGSLLHERAKARFNKLSWDDIENLSLDILMKYYPDVIESDVSEELSTKLIIKD